MLAPARRDRIGDQVSQRLLDGASNVRAEAPEVSLRKRSLGIIFAIGIGSGTRVPDQPVGGVERSARGARRQAVVLPNAEYRLARGMEIPRVVILRDACA